MHRKKITITDVAKAAGVSIATVSRVVNHVDRVEPSAAKRVREAMYTLGYVPKKPNHPNAVIALVVPSLENPFFSLVVEGILSRANIEGETLLVFSSEGSAVQEKKNLHWAAKLGVDGLLFCPLSDTSASLLPALFAISTPVVIIYRHDYCDFASHIYYDNEMGGYLATKYLLKAGHRQIAFFASFWGDKPSDLLNFHDRRLMGSYSSLDRLKGYQNALEEYGVTVHRELLCSTGYTYESGYAMTRHFLSSLCDFTAIICCNDSVAAGVLQALREQNIEVPRQVSVIGYDASFLSDITRPSLSSVHQDPKVLGRTAFDQLQARRSGEGKADVILKPNLVIKSSTGQCENKEQRPSYDGKTGQ